jgi:glycosyltransferase involved in cell wall biosynthesis
VAAAAAALPETVGDSGLLFAPYDAAELATKVCELLEQVSPHPTGTRPQHPLLAAATAHVGEKPLLSKDQTIGFVTPRYGTAILGGAERLIRGWAEELARRGYPVEVLTTCTARMDDWSNHYSPGVEQINGVTVRRFATDRVNSHVFHAVMERANQGERVHYQDEQAFAQNNLQSTDLNAYLREHSARFVCVFFAPYLFGTSYWGAQQVPGKAMLVPCMHDEASARLLVFREMLEEAHSIFFNTEAESEFTSTELGLINPFRTVVGYGFDVNLPSGDGDAFRVRHNLPAQFLLYSGRLEYGKNVPLLLDYFVRYKEEHPGDLALVLTGSGNVPIPPRPDIVALGVLPEAELSDAFAAALALCQPSRNESFSIVMMESWLQRRPCIVHARCPVTSGHVHSSEGGSIFDDYVSFCEAVEQLRHNPSTADLQGQRGYHYVCATYAWDVVIARLLEGITRFTRPTSRYERLARCGVRRALDFAPQRFDDVFLAVVKQAYNQRFGINQQQRHQLQQAIRAAASGASISPAPDGRVRAQLRQWSQRVMGFLGIASPDYRQNEQQDRFNYELFETLLPMLDQNFAEQRRLHREIALLRSQLRSPVDNATMEDTSQHNHLV